MRIGHKEVEGSAAKSLNFVGDLFMNNLSGSVNRYLHSETKRNNAPCHCHKVMSNQSECVAHTDASNYNVYNVQSNHTNTIVIQDHTT